MDEEEEDKEYVANDDGMLMMMAVEKGKVAQILSNQCDE